MLVFSPAFVADCLETIYEVKVEYAKLFKEHGGDTLHLAESLNDNDEWVEALEKIILGQ
jgi:ferrochelatase